MKIDFGKIWMSRKKPLVVLKENLGKKEKIKLTGRASDFSYQK